MDDTPKGIWDFCTNSALKRASRQLGQLYEDVLAPSGLRGTQYSLLSQIAHSKNASLRTLADLLVMDLSALGHTLKPLIRDGYVELVPDASDRRVKRVQLTPFGAKKQRETTDLWRKAQARFDNALGKQEAEALRRALNGISEASFAEAFTRASDGTEPGAKG
ncbi:MULTISPECIES: MarR family winged helix-turn-helix transcriptional regulator [Ensifer]|jgi:DNA-binding MarR family transcriptional regulator|uniref:MarR family transcriptional regulator n=1 Tax=Ensifer canadensis TaxID=555315 RepID=A0AAW4FEL6_9HYPH|nr:MULTISPECIES: MarR family winged helix-turn-helix transcriptional regulator [Ensifer]MDP9629679.1 DNA-binding MarR family transcriptional regulator [Ensifer adhaerens]KQU71951.1 MarR family transcriptional regulator [Ensifer sp. Root31]KQW44138.1 MarR family transcriptional regulator [Ensifer sp. Root1252]KQW84288.1 MarR family transcriptional regulator [Ensifer sp. Root127]KQY61215.1 MarR family transcriptional regulator [Ensifer sp. Root142]